MNKRILYTSIALGMVIVTLLGASILMGNDEAAPQQTNTATTSLPEPGLVSPATYQQQFTEAGNDHFLVDVRTPREYEAGHIEGAVNIPLQSLQAGQSFDQIPEDQNVVVYCRSGNRSGTARGLLQQAGYEDVYDISGGTIAWTNAGYPLR